MPSWAESWSLNPMEIAMRKSVLAVLLAVIVLSGCPGSKGPDEQLAETVKGLTNLKGLGLGGTRVTGAGLEHLKGLTNLETLYLEGTQVTDAGVASFKEALPNCRIRR